MSKVNNKLALDINKRGENIQILMNQGYSFNKANKSITKFYKQNGLVADRKGGFRPSFYDFLREGKKSMDNVGQFILSNGSDYDVKKASIMHYVKIWELVESVRK